MNDGHIICYLVAAVLAALKSVI
ncbi:hypothetical protein LSEI_2378 [Lacticaseibacillus paracasei ATCC 334]|uniref:Uncharacterized protein n=1 Tax=Lacticaseibacillus paracasei (strain ATCC 334 / BCRC 17002 / CCUG 31169 / CIP 107868 / KCTC 3260 / NRRL B-441) TaxID=321967 RepID=Q035K2_LACP3|nr:hypothetical protein LSEI_2378 [Lacticaseibacillus paracasei ATCC 334]CAQ67620.1 Putative uncharacterized protein [Lacticaseibacillus paracasei]